MLLRCEIAAAGVNDMLCVCSWHGVTFRWCACTHVLVCCIAEVERPGRLNACIECIGGVRLFGWRQGRSPGSVVDTRHWHQSLSHVVSSAAWRRWFGCNTLHVSDHGVDSFLSLFCVRFLQEQRHMDRNAQRVYPRSLGGVFACGKCL